MISQEDVGLMPRISKRSARREIRLARFDGGECRIDVKKIE